MSKDKQTSRRFYVVKEKSDGIECLVEAASPTSALGRAAAFYCDVRIAKPSDIIDMMKRGSDVIEIPSGEDLEPPLEEPQVDVPATVPERDLV